MRLVILGAGRLGLHIAKELIAEKHDVVVIEKKAELAQIVDNELDCLVLNEDGSRPETLRKAGTASADWFIALTGSDAVNMVACGLVAAEASHTKTIARMETPFYSALSQQQRRTFGLDLLINPAVEAARGLMRIIAEGFAEHAVPLHDGSLQLRMMVADDSCSIIGQSMAEVRQQDSALFLIAAIVRNGEILVPHGDTSIQRGERFYALGERETLNTFFGPIEGLQTENRKIIVLGATRLGEQLLSYLVEGPKQGQKGKYHFSHLFKRKLDILLIDEDDGACRNMAKLFPQIDVVCGDSGEEGFLESIGIKNADLFVGASNSQSKNIISAQLAKLLGCKKTMAFTQNHRYQVLGPHLDIDSWVCTVDEVVSTVLAEIRRAHIKTIYSFYEDSVEIVELKIEKNAAVQGRALREIALPKGVLVAFVYGKNGFRVPTGNSLLFGGDVVALISPKHLISDLERIFSQIQEA